jgi:uncharacterized membrane-anchored protein
MGLREATFLTVILSTTAIAGAEPRPAKAEPAKATKPAKQPAAAEPKTAERSAPAAPERPDPAAEEDQDDPAAEALPPQIVGPRTVDLGHNTTIDLPEGFILIERAQAQEIARKAGNSAEGLVALVFRRDSDWTIVIDYDDSGYIDDSDADDLDADDLLESYREGTHEQNKTRRALGHPDLEVDGWTERPRYERAQHHLVWGLVAHTTGEKVVNFFTRILGRNGYLSVNLIDSPEQIESSKKEALAILQATRFNPGSTYADHISSDKSSGIGLRGLVLGGTGVAVATKLGLLAKFGALLLKLVLVLKKGFIVIVLGLGALFRWLFRRKPPAAESDPMASQVPPDSLPPPDGMGPG